MKNKVLIACLMIGAGALVACADGVTGTPETVPVSPHWYNVTTTCTNGGSFVENEDAVCEVVNGKFEIESDLENPIVFNATHSLTQDMSCLSFTLTASVSSDETLPTPSTGTKVAFSLHEQTDDNDVCTTNLMAWVGGSAWVALTGADVPTGEFTLNIEFDNRNSANKVRFSIGSAVLKSNGVEWLDYSTRLGQQVSVGFAGVSKVASFLGDQLRVIAEIIPVGGGTIKIKDEDLKKFNPPSGKTVDEFIASVATEAYPGFKTSNITVGAAYALGLIADNGEGTMAPVDGGELKAKAIAESGSAGGIKLGLNVTPPADTGATISFKVFTGDSEITGATVTSASGVLIPKAALPTSGELKTFKVQAVVTPAPVNAN